MFQHNHLHLSAYSSFLSFLLRQINAIIAFIRHQNDHIGRSPNLPDPINPTNAANPNNTIIAILLPLPFDCLVDTDTIPPDNIMKATIIPAVPENSSLPSTVFTKPTAHD